MKTESIVYSIAGMCFGVILGWVLATQQMSSQVSSAATPPSQAQGQAPAGGGQPPPPTLDEARVQQLTTLIESDPKNSGAAVQLGNTYFDAEQYDNAIKWYEQALKLNPNDPNASTDLGVSYYYTNRPDDALRQFETSLKLDPRHTKTLLNQGIVQAFGKQNLDAAADSWKKVVEIAPNSPEGQAAQRGLEGIAASRGSSTPTTNQ